MVEVSLDFYTLHLLIQLVSTRSRLRQPNHQKFTFNLHNSECGTSGITVHEVGVVWVKSLVDTLHMHANRRGEAGTLLNATMFCCVPPDMTRSRLRTRMRSAICGAARGRRWGQKALRGVQPFVPLLRRGNEVLMTYWLKTEDGK